MRSFLQTMLLALWLLPLGLPAAEIQPFTAHYKARFSIARGESVTTLSQDANGVYVLETRAKAKGFASFIRSGEAIDRSEFVIDNNQLRPMSFSFVDGSKKNESGSTIAFDWAEGSAASSYKGESLSLELTAGMLDRQLLQIAMMSDLSDGATEGSYTIIDRNAVKTYKVSVVAEEQIDVPAGSFEVVKLLRENPGSSRTTVFWCAPSLNYLTVKMEQLKNGKVIGSLELSEIDS